MCVDVKERAGERVLFARECRGVGADVGECAIIINDEHRELYRTDVRYESSSCDEGWHSYFAGGGTDGAAGCAAGVSDGGTTGAGTGAGGAAGMPRSDALGSVRVSAHCRCALRTASILASQMSIV